MRRAPELVGRDEELAAVHRFLAGTSAGPAILLLEGPAGIGKTSLWGLGVDWARSKGALVVTSRPTSSESALPFCALADLLREVPAEALGALPTPQRTALEVALLRRVAPDPPPDVRAIGTALLTLLGGVARDRALVVAVDDIQWLDAETARVLAFALRRLSVEDVRVLLASRAQDADGALGWSANDWSFDVISERLAVGPLAPDSIARVIRNQLGRSLDHAAVSRLHEACAGNPFHAVEIARQVDWQRLEPGHPLVLPGTISELVGARLEGLSDAALEVLLVVATTARPTPALIRRAVGISPAANGIREAVAAGVLEVTPDRLRLSHPLIGSAIQGSLSEDRRRLLHARLAAIVADPDERARHLALGTEASDAAVADELEESARRARRRGAPIAAAGLFRDALRVTPPDDGAATHRRTIEAARGDRDAGSPKRAVALLRDAVRALPPGPMRADALNELGIVLTYTDGIGAGREAYQQALREPGITPVVEARTHQRLGWSYGWTMERGPQARHAIAGVRAARVARDEPAEMVSLATLGIALFHLGRPCASTVIERAFDLEQGFSAFLTADQRPSLYAGILAFWSDDLPTARAAFQLNLDRCRESGDQNSLYSALYYLAQLEVTTGDWAEASRHADEALEVAEQAENPMAAAGAWFCQTLVLGHMGRVEGARSAAEAGLRSARAIGQELMVLRLLGALGLIELSLERYEQAEVVLATCSQRLFAAGVREAGPFHMLADHAEALVGCGRPEEAVESLDHVARLGREPGRPWSIGAIARGRALAQDALGRLDEAIIEADRAIQVLASLGDPFELARAQLVGGILLRRRKRKADARVQLARALEAFSGLGAAVWSSRARAEIARIGGRSTGLAEMSETEAQVARLAAEGLRNREIAGRLFTTEKTVEVHLSRIYSKLGVRGRTELALAWSRRATKSGDSPDSLPRSRS